jgi:hypothetical protein
MREEQLNLNLDLPKAAKSRVRIKTQLLNIIEKNDVDVDNIMDILHNPKRIAKYQSNQLIKTDFTESVLSECGENIINFDDFDLQETENINCRGFLDNFNIK